MPNKTWLEATSPTVSTSIVTDSSTFTLLNTPSEVNGFGAATLLSIGSPSTRTSFGSGRGLIAVGQLEIGRTDNVSSSPYIDFHSGTTSVDYDSRIIATGGSGASGGGDLSLVASGLYLNTPYIVTNLTTLEVFNTSATNISAFYAASTLGIGYNGTDNNTQSFANSATASGKTKTVNIGTGAASGSTTNVNIGSIQGGTTTIGAVLTINGLLNVYSSIELGKVDGTANTPYVDFHAGATATDYDARIICTSGNGTTAQGGLTVEASLVTFSSQITCTNSIKSTGASGGIGYGTGSGGTVTQLTSKSTAVTLNKINGTITMNNASLAANAVVFFTVNNSVVSSTDGVVVNHSNGGTLGDYSIQGNVFPSGGALTIAVRNVTAVALAVAIEIKFIVIKGANS